MNLTVKMRYISKFHLLIGKKYTIQSFAKKSKVNAAGNYTKPEVRKSLYQQIKAQATHGTKAGQWSARKAQLLAKKYKEKGGGYRD